jgi:S-adenosylmethionine hydrolase
MSAASPTITLTTDFGTRDSYVAQIKGVLLAVGPAHLRIVDLGHEIAPQDVREAAFFLRGAVPRFPAGTIHLAVIDPGVGSTRRPIAAEVAGQFLVGPDNGVFGWLLGESARVHALDPARVGLRELAATFHGRDLFAPAAARLACGSALDSLGDAILDPIQLAWPRTRSAGHAVLGEIVHVDRYGNLISNLERADLPAAPAACVVSIAGRDLGGVRTHYAEAVHGDALALFGSGGLLEIAVRDGNAAHALGASVSSAVQVASAVVESGGEVRPRSG